MNKLTNIFLNGRTSETQQEAIKKLAESDYNFKNDKLSSRQNTKLFIGDYNNFKDTEFASLFKSDEELEAMFNLIDKNGDGIISRKEINELAKLGTKGDKRKIDNYDIKALMRGIRSTNNDNEETEKTGKKVTFKYKMGQGETSTHVCDKKGRLRKDIRKDSDGNIISVTTYKYDKAGNLINETKKDGEGNFVNQTKYERNAKGKILKITYKDAQGSDYETDAKGKILNGIKVIQTTDYTVLKYEYKNGIQVKCTRECTYEDKKTTEEFENDKLISKVEKDLDGNIISSTTYEYDENGQKTKQTLIDKNGCQYISEYKNGKEVKHTIINADGTVDAERTYEYDDNGKLIRKTEVDANGNVRIYDGEGNLIEG